VGLAGFIGLSCTGGRRRRPGVHGGYVLQEPTVKPPGPSDSHRGRGHPSMELLSVPTTISRAAEAAMKYQFAAGVAS